MQNPFCRTRDEMHRMLIAYKRAQAQAVLEQMRADYSEDEIRIQVATQQGPIMEELNRRNAEFISNTNHVEFFWSLQLADFYFPYQESNICFELNNNANTAQINNFEQLIAAINDHTYIDFEISSGDERHRIQLKTYPTQFRDSSHDEFWRWLCDDVIGGYCDDMSGTKLVISVVPGQAYENVPIDFTQLHTDLAALEGLSFDEVAVVYNDAGRHAVLHKLFPEHRRVLIQSDWQMARFRGEV